MTRLKKIHVKKKTQTPLEKSFFHFDNMRAANATKSNEEMWHILVLLKR